MMNPTRDVVVDLWPLYVSGEASADTRALVETFLEQDRELGERLRQPEGAGLRPLALALPADHERATLLAVPALDPARQALLDETRRLVSEVASRLEGLGVADATRKALADSREQLALPFLLVVVGEFNAGKSAFINALLGARVLEEGVTPTTSRVGILHHGSEVTRRTRPDGIEETTAPADALRALAIVDTPGTNAVLREHEALTRDFLPRADLVLFVTSADRPYTESERAFLEAIREWGKKVVLVLNKADLLETPADLAKVVAFVRDEAAKTLGAPPEVFALSAREALRSREQGDAAMLERSGLPAFEAKVTATLDEKERFRLKLQNPLGVARRAHQEATGLVGQRLEVLGGDLAALEAIEKRVAEQSAELTRDFRFRLSDVEKALLEFERRGNAFFDERLRLGRFRELFDRERLRRDFEAEAVAGLPHEVERRVDGIVDWMVEAELRQWQDVMALLAERPAARPGSEGRVDDRFAYDRSRLLESVRDAAREAVLHYDAPSEARRLAEKVRESVAQAALLQVSALGLGHHRGRARQHHRRRRHRHPGGQHALAHRPASCCRRGARRPAASSRPRSPRCARSS